MFILNIILYYRLVTFALFAGIARFIARRTATAAAAATALGIFGARFFAFILATSLDNFPKFSIAANQLFN